MMNQRAKLSRFRTAVIFVTAITWAAFAVWLGTSPAALLTTFGVEASSPTMLTEVRAFYGGVELAIAAAMIALWWRGELFASLLIGGLPLFGSACGRLCGLALDGYSQLHLGLATLELVGASLCLFGCFIMPKRRGDVT